MGKVWHTFDANEGSIIRRHVAGELKIYILVGRSQLRFRSCLYSQRMATEEPPDKNHTNNRHKTDSSRLRNENATHRGNWINPRNHDFLKITTKTKSTETMRETGLSGDCGCKWLWKNHHSPAKLIVATSFSPWFQHSFGIAYFLPNDHRETKCVSAIMDDNFSAEEVYATAEWKKATSANDAWKWEEIAIKTSEWCPLYQLDKISWNRWIQPSIVDQGEKEVEEQAFKNSWKTTTHWNSFVHIACLIIIVYIFISLVGKKCVLGEGDESHRWMLYSSSVCLEEEALHHDRSSSLVDRQ